MMIPNICVGEEREEEEQRKVMGFDSIAVWHHPPFIAWIAAGDDGMDN